MKASVLACLLLAVFTGGKPQHASYRRPIHGAPERQARPFFKPVATHRQVPVNKIPAIVVIPKISASKPSTFSTDNFRSLPGYGDKKRLQTELFNDLDPLDAKIMKDVGERISRSLKKDNNLKVQLVKKIMQRLMTPQKSKDTLDKDSIARMFIDARDSQQFAIQALERLF